MDTVIIWVLFAAQALLATLAATSTARLARARADYKQADGDRRFLRLAVREEREHVAALQRNLRAYAASQGTLPGYPDAAMQPTADLASGFSRLSAVMGRCAHAGTVPVHLLVTGELAAWLCPDCGRQLPATWRSVAD